MVVTTLSWNVSLYNLYLASVDLTTNEPLCQSYDEHRRDFQNLSTNKGARALPTIGSQVRGKIEREERKDVYLFG